MVVLDVVLVLGVVLRLPSFGVSFIGLLFNCFATISAVCFGVVVFSGVVFSFV